MRLETFFDRLDVLVDESGGPDAQYSAAESTDRLTILIKAIFNIHIDAALSIRDRKSDSGDLCDSHSGTCASCTRWGMA
jgi:hypothetical protein